MDISRKGAIVVRVFAFMQYGESDPINKKKSADPRANCWINKTKMSRNVVLRKRFKRFRPSVPISEKTSFRFNGMCRNAMCANPFHYSPNFYRERGK